MSLGSACSITIGQSPRNLTLLQQTSPSSRSAQDEALDRLLSPAPLRVEPTTVSVRAPDVPEVKKSTPLQLSAAQDRDFALQPAHADGADEGRSTIVHSAKIALALAFMAAILWFVWQRFPHEKGIACLPNCSSASLPREEMAGFTLRSGNFSDANLQGADLRDASLYQALFLRANLREAVLVKADLSQAILAYADLRGADLSNANLRHADLRDADLRDANLSGVDLRGANLEGATLLRANLQGAVLTEANFDGAIMRRANLQNADLRRASLRLADLRRANLLHADFTGADLGDVILDDNQAITPLQTGAP